MSGLTPSLHDGYRGSIPLTLTCLKWICVQKTVKSTVFNLKKLIINFIVLMKHIILKYKTKKSKLKITILTLNSKNMKFSKLTILNYFKNLV